MSGGGVVVVGGGNLTIETIVQIYNNFEEKFPTFEEMLRNPKTFDCPPQILENNFAFQILAPYDFWTASESAYFCLLAPVKNKKSDFWCLR